MFNVLKTLGLNGQSVRVRANSKVLLQSCSLFVVFSLFLLKKKVEKNAEMLCVMQSAAVEDPELCRQRRSLSGLFRSHTSCKGGGVHLSTALVPIMASCLTTERALAFSIFMMPVKWAQCVLLETLLAELC